MILPPPRLALAASVLLVALSSRASEVQETSEFADVAQCVSEYADQFGVGNVLLVVDIDNTLLTMKRSLGSDPWFEWQHYLLKHEPDSPLLVASNFGDLLDAQGLLFTLGRMKPPQPDLPALVARLQAQGVKTLVLTSRGPQFRVPTQRELVSAGYDFSSSALPLSDMPGGTFLPYDVEAIEKSGLTPEEARLFGLGEPRKALYDRGVFMTAGQHKGAMLLAMLAKSERTFRAIIFVDDHGRHVLRVYDALARREIEATVFHYQREDANVKRFKYSDKRDVTSRWRRLQKTLDQVFDGKEK